MRCLVIEADDNQARELVIIENLERENVTAIEEAFGFQQLIDAGQYNQKTLAERLGRDPSFVSNRMRLLALPEEWRQRIVDGDILPTQARLLVPWADRPALLHQIAVQLAKAVAPDSDEDDEEDDEEVTAEQPATQRQVKDLSCDEVSEIITQTIYKMTRCMEPTYWNGPKFEVTEEIREQLDVVQVPHQYLPAQRSLVAFNVTLWDQLQDEAIAKKTQRPADDTDDDSDAIANDDDESPTAGATARLNDYVLNRSMRIHVSSVLAAHLKNDAVTLRAFLWLLLNDQGWWFAEWTAKRASIDLDGFSDDRKMWRLLDGLTIKTLPGEAREFMLARLTDPKEASIFTLEQVCILCEELKVNPVANWVPEQEMLELCSDAQLREILTLGDMATEKQAAKWNRKRLLKEAIDNWQPGYVPMLLTPSAMQQAHQAQSQQPEQASDE